MSVNVFVPGSYIGIDCYQVPSFHVILDVCNKKVERSSRDQVEANDSSLDSHRFEMKTRVPKKTQKFKQLIKQLRIYWVVGTDDFYPGITFGTELYFPNNKEELLRIIKTYVDDWTTSDRLKKYHVKVSGKSFVMTGLDKTFRANKAYPLHEMLDHTSTNHVESFKGRDLYRMYLDYDDLSVMKVELIQTNTIRTKSVASVLFDEDVDGDTDTEPMSLTSPGDQSKQVTTETKKKLSPKISKLISSSKCKDDSFLQLVASLVKYESLPINGVGKYGALIEQFVLDRELPHASTIIENSICTDYEFLKLVIELRMNDIVALDQFYSFIAKWFTPSHPSENRKLWQSCETNLKMTW